MFWCRQHLGMAAGRKRKREGPAPKLLAIPKVHLKEKADALLEAYKRYCVLHLPQALSTGTPGAFTWKSIPSLFESLTADKESWCIENGGKAVSAKAFLRPKVTTDRGYCSFLLQKDKDVFDATLSRLPLREVPATTWTYGPCVWFFFGRNVAGAPLEGRPEHTDSISHDGTWHFQLSGCKRWYLRPSEELVKRLSEEGIEGDSSRALVVDCEEGDVLIVNTRLWWHRTEIPVQKAPSVSYARDFYMDRKEAEAGFCSMSNVDGLYAAADVEAHTIVFREDAMPDAELHRSSDPNCEVVELEDGTGAVVSRRRIAAGEFFCVAPSDDESDGEEVEFEEEDEEYEDDSE